MNAIVSLLAEQRPGLDLADTEAAHVSVKSDATIVYRLNRGEHQRRQASGLTGMTRLDQLDLMMELPAGLPVQPRDTDWRMVKKLPRGCVDITTGGVVRQIVKPLDVRLAVVTGQQWTPGLTRAGRFAPFCSRVLALSGKPRNLTEKAIEADFWGIGLVINAATEPELVVAPTAFVPQRHTPAGWAFAEEIYRQIVAQDSPVR